MSSVAQKQDLSDPDVIRAFAGVGRDERRLVALYLLTVADIRGTSPKVWNALERQAAGGSVPPRRGASCAATSVGYDQDVQAKQAEALRLLRLYALSERGRGAVARARRRVFPAPRAAGDRLADAHPALPRRHRAAGGEGAPLADRRRAAGDDLRASDEADLFARICGYFESINYIIVDAKIHTTRHGYALDTLPACSGPAPRTHYRDMIGLIEHELAERLERRTPLARARARARVAPAQALPDHARGQHPAGREGRNTTCVSIIAGDRPGLLYGIARVLGKYHINLHTAKIVTLGERAEDVFRDLGRGAGEAEDGAAARAGSAGSAAVSPVRAQSSAMSSPGNSASMKPNFERSRMRIG